MSASDIGGAGGEDHAVADLEHASSRHDERRRGRIDRAIKDWTAQLVDLTGNNRLLNFKENRTGGSIIFDGANVNDVELGRLLGGATVDLSSLFLDEGIASRAARLARAARKTSTTNFEERGLKTLYLAWGMATWDIQGNGSFAGVDEEEGGDDAEDRQLRRHWTPNAPVLLQELTLEAHGGIAEDFKLALNGEWELNPTLVHSLGVMGAEVDAEAIVELLGPSDDRPRGLDVFQRLRKVVQVAGVATFRIKPQVVLGNFSYAKLPMVRDLGLSSELLLASDLICAIAGDEEARQAIRERHPEVAYDEVDHIAPEDEFLVCDADSSQTLAINAVVKGADLVIQGPPGTGKSQTIANLIATLAARGKRVLFVAEKRAAIDVVIERLEKAGLGDLVLDLHSSAKSRVQIVQQLNKAMVDASTTPAIDASQQHEKLMRRRQSLVERTAALHQKRDPWGLSVYEIQAELLGIPEELHSKKRFSRQTIEELSVHMITQCAEDLAAYIGAGGFDMVWRESPWLGALRKGSITSPEQAQMVLDQLTAFAERTFPDTSAKVTSTFAEVGLRAPAAVNAWADALRLLERTSAVLQQFDPAVFDLDLREILSPLAPLERSALPRTWHVATDKRYREAVRAVKAAHKTGEMAKGELVDALRNAADLADEWRAASDGGHPRLPADVESTEGIYRQFRGEVEALEGVLDAADLQMNAPEALTERLTALLDDRTTLFVVPQLHQLRTSLNGCWVSAAIEEALERHLDAEQAVTLLRSCWLASILDTVSIADKHIGMFRGDEHTRTVREFSDVDRQHLAATPYRIRRLIAERIVGTRERHPSQSDLLKKQAVLKRKLKPIRELFTQAPQLLTALKPCWAMSPLVVSQLLPATKCFDVVIFDEASQVAPADAVGALMRADRAVVAGDSKQLPPTRFFASGETDDEEDEVEDEEIDLSVTSGVQSVLELMCAVLPVPKGQQTLRWHYRSKDERLIAFSNSQELLYRGSLVTFPGVTDEEVITHHLVPFTPTGIKHKGTLPEEVEKVVELVTAHAHTHRDRSLGVIALGSPHANAIEESLRLARRDDRTLDAFMDAEVGQGRERFFTKNLERVQGDERDAIILTLGYGRAPDGRMRYTFGPLNGDGGERRLNVAVTRARRSMTVVSSFPSNEMDPDSLKSDGAKMLRGYLAFVESGGADLGPHDRPTVTLNPFEQDVLTHLTERGITLHPQYGCSGYWIDFAAQHPDLPGRYVLAIETDGARYHSSPTARDRDRLRQDHLERLGWRFHRIWSTDWFYRREEEIERACRAYERALRVVNTPPRLAPTRRANEPAPPAFQAPAAARRGPKPVTGGLGTIGAYTDKELIDLVTWLESDTLMRTEDELLMEAIKELGFQRRGPKIVQRLNLAIRLVRSSTPGAEFRRERR